MRGGPRAAAMITDNQCYQLAQNLHLQHIAIERKQIDDFFQLDDDFHQKLAQIADCQLAWIPLKISKRQSTGFAI
ncbi:regulatory protein [Salmonella enterica subsp. enterica serovar Madelia]|nr:regulatory protein [Salmonella enterica subsp. enterica serovar Madelia]